MQKELTNKNAKIIMKAAKELGAQADVFSAERNVIEIIYKNKSFFVLKTFVLFASQNSTPFLAKHKELSHWIFEKNGLPTPKSYLIGKGENLEKFLDKIEYPVVIKESSACQSRNIYTDIKDKETALKIMKKVLAIRDYILLQKMIYGSEYRVLVLDKEIIGVLKMIPPSVIGDGKNKIKDLIAEKSKHTEKPINVDEKLILTLKNQGFGLDDVLEKDKKVFLRTHSSYAEGGEVADETDNIHEKAKEICVKAAKAVNLSLAGLDILCDDIAKNPDEQNFNILEINNMPDLSIHYDPTYGKTRDVAKEVLKYVFKVI